MRYDYDIESTEHLFLQSLPRKRSSMTSYLSDLALTFPPGVFLVPFLESNRVNVFTDLIILK